MYVKDYVDFSAIEALKAAMKDSDRLRFTLYTMRVLEQNGFWLYTELQDRPLASLFPDEIGVLKALKEKIPLMIDAFLLGTKDVADVLDSKPRSLLEVYAFIDCCQELSVDPRDLNTPADFGKLYNVDPVTDIAPLVRGNPTPKTVLNPADSKLVARFFEGTITDVVNFERGRK
jgi:hypothetical protein